jgi:hypothetical protein
MQKVKHMAFAKPETVEETEVPYFEVVVEDKNQHLQEIMRYRQLREKQVYDQLKSSSVSKYYSAL